MPQAVYYQILVAVGESVASVPLVETPSLLISPTGDPIGVSVRKKPVLLETDSIPRIIVWPGRGGEKRDEQQFGVASRTAGVWYIYPIQILLFTAGNREVEKGLPEYMALREAIRDQLFQQLPFNPATIFDYDIDPEDTFDLQAYLGGNYDLTGWQMYYKSAESHATASS